MDVLGLPFDLLLQIIIPIVVLTMVLITLGVSSIKRVKESERIVVSRRGRFIGIAGPGLVLIIPGIDRVLRIKLNELDEEVPGWQGLSKEELDKKIETLIQDLPKKRGMLEEYSLDDYSYGTISGKVQKKYLHERKHNRLSIILVALSGGWGAWAFDYDTTCHIIINSSRDVFTVRPDDYNRIREGDLITMTYHPGSRIVERVTLGEDLANVARDLEALAELYEGQGKDVEAARLRKKTLEKQEELKEATAAMRYVASKGISM